MLNPVNAGAVSENVRTLKHQGLSERDAILQSTQAPAEEPAPKSAGGCLKFCPHCGEPLPQPTDNDQAAADEVADPAGEQ